MRPRLELPRLYAIVNISTLHAPLEFVDTLLSSGVRLLQLRPKPFWDKPAIALAKEILELKTRYAGAQVIVNDDPEVCAMLAADGVHLGQGDLSPVHARKLLPESAIIGLSTHTLEQLKGAAQESIDYLALGPIYLSSTKQGHADCVGLKTLAAARMLCQLPMVAIGGITRFNAHDVFATGVDSVAVISDLEQAEDIPAVVRAYLG